MGNALSTMPPASPSSAAHGGAVALIPTNMREAMDLARMMAENAFLPEQLRNPAACLMVVELSMRWAMSPFAVAGEVAFVSGKPMLSGKVVAAAVQSSPRLSGRLSYHYAGEGNARTVTVRGTLRGESDPRDVTVRLSDARTSNVQWTKQPDQQLAYHASRMWARRHLPEVLLGVWSPEEVDDITPPPPPAPPAAYDGPDRRRPSGQMRAQAGPAPRIYDADEHGGDDAMPADADDVAAAQAPPSTVWCIVSRTGEIKEYPEGDGEDWRRQWSYRMHSVERAQYPVAQRVRTLAAMLAVNADAFADLRESGHGDMVDDVMRQAEEARGRMERAIAEAEAIAEGAGEAGGDA